MDIGHRPSLSDRTSIRQDRTPRTSFQEEKAPAGLFHITFDRDTPYQLLRISLPVSVGMYPEISGSHYRCSVRFLEWKGLTARPTQTTLDVPFILSCCG